ncbi:hypothetical protein XENOCAPTIV_001329 [Xenoophorus captivus]|uniref:Uncharacterized protein n=1 Tax=Xenoophorus captivus TaxID=1517983 RepID=A0ABV0QFV0_9TELE
MDAFLGRCSHWEEAQGKAQDTLERLCLSAGLGTPWAPPRGAGGGVWGEGRLGISAEYAAPATQSRIKRKTTSTSTFQTHILWIVSKINIAFLLSFEVFSIHFWQEKQVRLLHLGSGMPCSM